MQGAKGLEGMREETRDDAEEVSHVGELGVGVEGRFVEPFGVNGEGERFAKGLEEMNAKAAGFAARGGDNAPQFLAELLVLAGDGFEAEKDVEGHGGVEL